jgi:hypothetical protein
VSDVWLGTLGLIVGVIGAWGNLRALVVLIVKIPIGMARGILRIITCPDPVSCQLADGVDNLGYWLGCWFGYRRFGDDPLRYPRLFTASGVPLTTWLRRPAAGLDSYRRHLQALREYEASSPEEDLIDKLREWSVRYGMVNPD